MLPLMSGRFYNHQRNTLWKYGATIDLLSENMFSKFGQYVSAIKAGLVKRLASKISSYELQTYSRFLNLLLLTVSLHLLSTVHNI